jgi:hypothetical protein
MLGAIGYKAKKDLKAAIGRRLNFTETIMFGQEFPESGNGQVTVVGPCAYTSRKWFAQVKIENGLIAKVS